MATEEAIGTLPAVNDKAELVVRELPPEEFDLLLQSPLFQQFGLPNLQHTRVVVAQEVGTGKLAAYWMIYDAVHVEPLWIDDQHRKRPGLARQLWGGVQRVLEQTDANTAYATIADQDMAMNLPQATRLGFKKVPGALFYITVKGSEEGNAVEELLKKIQAAVENDGPPGMES